MKCPRCAHMLDKLGNGHHRQCLVQYSKDLRLYQIRVNNKPSSVINKMQNLKGKAVSLGERTAKKIKG